MKKLNLLDKDFKIVENRKIFFVVPIIILIISLIFMAVNVFITKEANQVFNLGMDFTGGYKMTVKLGDKITADNSDELANQIAYVFENNGVKKVKITTQSSGSDKAFVVSYQVPVGLSEEIMESVNEDISNELESILLNSVPVVTVDGNTVTAVYNEFLARDAQDSLIDKLESADFVVTATNKAIANEVVTYTFTLSQSNANVETLISILTIEDIYSGQIISSGRVSGSMSKTLISSAILAVVVALIVMLLYIAIRFKSLGFSAALATVIALAHDIIMMFCFMAIARVELGGNFVAGLVTILGYSINNTIVIFDRVRECNTLYKGKKTPFEIANKAVKDTFIRSVNTTFTTVVTITMLAILCVESVQIFALPIIVGLIAGAFSSVCVAPSIWAVMQTNKLNRLKKSLKGRKKRRA